MEGLTIVFLTLTTFYVFLRIGEFNTLPQQIFLLFLLNPDTGWHQANTGIKDYVR